MRRRSPGRKGGSRPLAEQCIRCAISGTDVGNNATRKKYSILSRELMMKVSAGVCVEVSFAAARY